MYIPPEGEEFASPEILENSVSVSRIYSARAIYGFSFFFTTIFGGVLLMRNLYQVGRRKEGNMILALSLLYTILTIVVANLPKAPDKSAFFMNVIGGIVLAQYFFKRFFPNHKELEKKSIWKPLIISLAISIPLMFLAIANMA